ncbi:MAG: type II secretion system GspH family protein [Lachnospiraceae bacterium]|nr:type II secretion system GspH family protein [Lachnospiraceae bacterium]
MKNRRKGFTLVEMLVAMGVMAIVLGEIAMILSSNLKIYTNGSIEVHLQEEASQVVQMLENLMIDATDSIDVTTSATITWPDASTSKPDKIVISNWKDPDNEALGKVTYTIELRNDKPKKNYGTLWITDPKGNSYPMADYVKDIKLKKDLYNKNSVVELQMEMQGDNYSYQVSKDIYNRNEIGTPKVDLESLGGSGGEKSLSVLRYHTYELSTMIPYDKEWQKVELTDASKLTEFQQYYDLDMSTFKLTPTDTLNGNNTRIPPTTGTYDLKFTAKAVDGKPPETFVLSIYSEKPEVIGGGQQLLYSNAVKSDSATTFIPLRGISAEDANKCQIDICVGDKVLQTETLDKNTGFKISQKDFGGFHFQVNANDGKDLTDQTSSVNGSIVYRTADINTVVLQTGMFNNANGKENNKYAKFFTDYEVLVYAKCTLFWETPNRDLTFKAFFYPVNVINIGDTKDSCFTNEQSNKFFELVADDGGTNSDLEITESDEGDDEGGDSAEISYTVSEGTFKLTGQDPGANKIWFQFEGTTTVTFDKNVTSVSFDNGSCSPSSGTTITFTPASWGSGSGNLVYEE